MKFFRFGSSTPPPPPPPLRPPAPPLARSNGAKRPASPRAKAPATPAGPSIIGRWQEPGSSDMTEFRSDGTLIERLGSGDTINGRYRVDGTNLAVKLDSGDELSFALALTANTLDLTDPNGQVAHYRRA